MLNRFNSILFISFLSILSAGAQVAESNPATDSVQIIQPASSDSLDDDEPMVIADFFDEGATVDDSQKETKTDSVVITDPRTTIVQRYLTGDSIPGSINFMNQRHVDEILSGVYNRLDEIDSILFYTAVDRHPTMMYLPAIFDKYQDYDEPKMIEDSVKSAAPATLNADDEWLQKAIKTTKRENNTLYMVICKHPDIVKYNITMLPEPPKQYVIVTNPGTLKLSLEERARNENPTEVPPKQDFKIKNWITDFNASVQFSQAYLSDNWYQGGNSNLNLLGHFVYNFKLNPVNHENLLFENTIQYKIGVNSAPQDSLRNYNINEDLLQINSKFGIKAANKWYYTASLQFKTQIFNNYAVNTNDMKASFMSPGELNLGLGMTYSHTNKANTLNFNASIAPASYNMKICIEHDKMNPETFGIDKDRSISNQIGSNIETKLTWAITSYISLTSRLYAFTNYEYVQGDFENTFNFSINKYLSTQFHFHLRYDSSAESDPDWSKWQFKEILSFGFNYRI